MANKKEMQSLLQALTAQPVLAGRGFLFTLEAPEVVAVHRGSHLRGIWRCEGGSFTWTPAGYATATHTVRDHEAALRYTLVALSTAN